jgi:hypothetical protein
MRNKTGKYNGRHSLLRDISGRSESTKLYIYEHLKMQLNRDNTAKLIRRVANKVAKKYGVKIGKLELQ